MTVSGSKFAFGVVKLFFQTKPGQNLYSQTLSESLCNVGYSLDWCTRGARAGLESLVAGLPDFLEPLRDARL